MPLEGAGSGHNGRDPSMSGGGNGMITEVDDTCSGGGSSARSGVKIQRSYTM